MRDMGRGSWLSRRAGIRRNRPAFQACSVGVAQRQELAPPSGDGIPLPLAAGESHLEISDSNCAQARRAGFESCEAGTAPIPRFQLEIEPAPNAIALPLAAG